MDLAKGKTLSTVIKLGGKVDESLIKSINKTKSQTASAAKAMSKAMSQSTMAASKAMSKSLKSMATGALKLFAVLKGISRLKDFANETMTAAKAQLEVQTKLATILENVKSIQIRGPNAAAEAAKELNKVADALETVGVIGNDVTLAGMQQLATYQLSEKEISALAGGMDDLLAQQKGLNATQSDAVSIANMLGKAMTGSVGALSKVGITFTEAQAKVLKTGDSMERAAMLAQILQENVGGVNKALGETDPGQLVQSQNTFDAIKENIGYFLIPLLNKLVKGALPYVQSGLEKLTVILDKMSPVIGDLISSGFNQFSEIWPVISQGITDFIPIFKQIISPFGRFKEVLPVIIDALHQIMPSISELITKLAPLTAQLMDNLLPIITQIIPLVANLISNILPVVITLFEEIAPVILDVVNQLSPLIDSIVKALVPAFEELIPPIMEVVKKILPVFISLIKMVAPFITDLVSEIAPLVGILIDALLPAFDAIIPPIMNLIQAILPPLKTLFTSIFGVIKSLAPVISVVAQVLSSVLGAAITTLTPIIQGIIDHFTIIMDTLSAVIDFVVNIFTGNWSAAWENVKSIFSGIFEGLSDVIKAPLNLVIGLINAAINGINGLTDVINAIPGVDIGEIPQIPYLAKGATVTKPTLAMIGEGKVPETVVPHNKSPRSLALLNEAARGVGASGTDFSYLPAVDMINSALSYFAEKFLPKSKPGPSTGDVQTVNNTGKTINVYYQPNVTAKDSAGVKEVLEDEFEKFKAFFKRLMDEEEREEFA